MNSRADLLRHTADGAPELTRCAIYTRKSTSEGLNADFNTLDAQREAAEHYIQAMRHEGWVLSPTLYDDGGFTGANTERPALKRLLTDIEAGEVDCVVVYKVDRLSRSIGDFAELLDLFDRHRVTFVSTTQNFNTTSSMGRLTLNILLSFAQFEREMIAERTRDKMSAARKRGKWLGSAPVLGYDGDREKMLLVVNAAEAERVNAIFGLYLRFDSLEVVAHHLNSIGWEKKRNITKAGRSIGGGAWRAKDVHCLLRNPTYLGKVRYKGAIYEGEHEAIVSETLYQQVQRVLGSKFCGRGLRSGRNPKYLIQGIVDCAICGARITTTAGRNRKRTTYRYYICSKRGTKRLPGCAQPRLSAPEVEALVVERVRARCADATLRDEIIQRMRAGESRSAYNLKRDREALANEERQLHTEGRQLIEAIAQENRTTVGKVLTERIREIERRLDTISTSRASLDAQLTTLEEKVAQLRETVDIMTLFDQLWEEMADGERQQLVRLVIKRVIIDEPAGRIDIEYHDLTEPSTPPEALPPVPPEALPPATPPNHPSTTHTSPPPSTRAEPQP